MWRVLTVFFLGRHALVATESQILDVDFGWGLFQCMCLEVGSNKTNDLWETFRTCTGLLQNHAVGGWLVRRDGGEETSTVKLFDRVVCLDKVRDDYFVVSFSLISALLIILTSWAVFDGHYMEYIVRAILCWLPSSSPSMSHCHLASLSIDLTEVM